MDLEQLTKSQVILLTLLVSFVTSIATAIFTVSMVNQAPPPITNTINKVVERIVSPLGIEPKAPVVTENKQPEYLSKEEAVISVVKKVSPAVVSVVATKDLPVIEQYYVNPFGGDSLLNGLDIQIPQYRQKGIESKEVGSGTGFFVTDDGMLLTNKHVVEDKEAKYTVIMNDGRKLEAKVLVRDPFQDLAIIKVEGKDFPSLQLGDSTTASIGQTVIAVGNTLGEFSNTVSVGIISGLNRKITAQGSQSGPEELKSLIQTDAAINRGNSGGPLVNLQGKVIGINTAVAEQAQSVGFALPINIAKRDVEDVKQFGKVEYPYIGVRYQAVDMGILVAKSEDGKPAVEAGSPAEKAGIKEGDIITEIGGVKISKENTLTGILTNYRVGDKLTIKLLRDKNEMSLELMLDKRPENT